ncbi:MAG: undecaprenyl diphosphate synthase family protein, partial [Pseudomonadota bacterium]
LYFTQTLWPDFSADDLAEALRAYAKRDRRFGGRPECATDPSGNTSDHGGTLPPGTARRCVPAVT